MSDGQAGKGDRYRKVDQKKFDKNWKRTFGKKKSKASVMQPGGIIDKSDVPKEKDK